MSFAPIATNTSYQDTLHANVTFSIPEEFHDIKSRYPEHHSLRIHYVEGDVAYINTDLEFEHIPYKLYIHNAKCSQGTGAEIASDLTTMDCNGYIISTEYTLNGSILGYIRLLGAVGIKHPNIFTRYSDGYHYSTGFNFKCELSHSPRTLELEVLEGLGAKESFIKAGEEFVEDALALCNYYMENPQAEVPNHLWLPIIDKWGSPAT